MSIKLTCEKWIVTSALYQFINIKLEYIKNHISTTICSKLNQTPRKFFKNQFIEEKKPYFTV